MQRLAKRAGARKTSHHNAVAVVSTAVVLPGWQAWLIERKNYLEKENHPIQWQC